MTIVPVTRSLAAVLRTALDTTPPVRMLIGEFGTSDPSGAYCNVILQGQQLRVPQLHGVTDTPGTVAYLLATKDFVLCIGSVAA
jgi:hypothetical protein